jgi:NAD(P)-dependent dehydrogenase (short-subunit alcohol dehydrogenase family)
VDPRLDVTGRAVLVAGAGRGIGRGIAEVLAESGADLVLAARTPDHLDGTAAAIAAATGRRVVPVVADMTDAADVGRTVATALDELGRLDVAFNMVGDGNFGPFTALTDDGLQTQLDLNLRTTMLCCRAVGRHFVERGAGKVVNVSSVSAARGGANLAAYTAAKAAVEGLSRALALEWAPFNVTVNCIAPGIFPDPHALGDSDGARDDALLSRIPLGRYGDVREIGSLAHYLAAPASDYVTGQVFRIDGGMSL